VKWLTNVYYQGLQNQAGNILIYTISINYI